jgi:hypothetical protein
MLKATDLLNGIDKACDRAKNALSFTAMILRLEKFNLLLR